MQLFFTKGNLIFIKRLAINDFICRSCHLTPIRSLLNDIYYQKFTKPLYRTNYTVVISSKRYMLPHLNAILNWSSASWCSWVWVRNSASIWWSLHVLCVSNCLRNLKEITILSVITKYKFCNMSQNKKSLSLLILNTRIYRLSTIIVRKSFLIVCLNPIFHLHTYICISLYIVSITFLLLYISLSLLYMYFVHSYKLLKDLFLHKTCDYISNFNLHT